MQLDFSQLTVNQLLDKLGKGGHKPGSGSAAALQGMISSKLVQTVIIISNRKKYQEVYKDVLPKLLQMSEEIDDEFFQNLQTLSIRMPFILIRQYKQELRHLKLRQNQIFMRLQG